jgi:peptide/nickel transport system substrate-binding protein
MKVRGSANRRMLAAATAALMGTGLVAVPGLPSNASSLHSAATAPELVMESSPESTITDDFNPFVSTAAPYAMGATGLIYEPLIEFDLAAPPKYYPWLASAFAWSNGGKTITFTMRSGVTWNDGVPMTPADVVFTFDLVKKYPAINAAALNIGSVTSSGNKVSVHFATAQYANLESIAGMPILPEHIWSKVGNPATFTDPTPVGTGPYVLGTFSPEGFTLKATTSYWQKMMMPKVPEVYFPAYSSNTTVLPALFDGKIDWTGNFIPGLQKNFVDKNPKEHGFWEAANGSNSLEPNLTKWPTNQLAVRQAMSAAISRNLLATEGEAGLEDPLLAATGLTLPTLAAWGGPVKNLTNPGTGSAAKAKAILEKAGYTLKGGYFYLNGKEVSLTIISPSSYTDMAEVDSIAAQEMRAAGIKATFQGLTTSAWNTDLASGDFQMSEHWSNGGVATPFPEYDNWLNSANISSNVATNDYERLDNPKVDAELSTLAGASTVAAQTADLVPLEKFVASYLPIIPVTTGSAWFEYDSQNYVGWPTAANPYESGQPSGTNNGSSDSGTDLVVILHLSPRK